MPQRRRSRSLVHKGISAAAAKRRRRQEDAQQRDNRLALARLAHYLASNLQVYHCGAIRVPSWKHRAPSKGSCRRSAVAVKPAEGLRIFVHK